MLASLWITMLCRLCAATDACPAPVLCLTIIEYGGATATVSKRGHWLKEDGDGMKEDRRPGNRCLLAVPGTTWPRPVPLNGRGNSEKGEIFEHRGVSTGLGKASRVPIADRHHRMYGVSAG
jgi:hypothetical protein